MTAAVRKGLTGDGGDAMIPPSCPGSSWCDQSFLFGRIPTEYWMQAKACTPLPPPTQKAGTPEAWTAPVGGGVQAFAFCDPARWHAKTEGTLATSKLQDQTRERLLAILTGFNFRENYRPDWLQYPETGRNLELDFFMPDLNVGIEVQGRQHFEYIPHFHASEDDFEAQKRRDQWKRGACDRYGVFLYEVASPQDIEQFLIEAERLHGDLFKKLQARNAALNSLGYLAEQLRIARGRKPASKARVESLIQRILAICKEHKFPVNKVQADQAARKADVAYFGHANVSLHWYDDGNQIRNAQRAIVMSVTGTTALVRMVDGCTPPETFDCEFDLTTGRQIGPTKYTLGWRMREHQAAKLLEIYESGDNGTIVERIREVREARAGYDVA